MHGQDLSDVWTPKLVRERLVEAIKWARYNAGPTGPAAVRAAMPTFLPSEQDFEQEGWGERERAEEGDEDKPKPRPLTPKKVSAIIDALHWQARYLGEDHKTSSEALSLWLKCKVYRGNFDKAVEARGKYSRRSAYNYLDRALGVIAQGLMRDGIAP